MRIFLVGASLALLLSAQAQVMAKAPDSEVELVAVDDTTKCHVREELTLSTSLDTVVLTQVQHVPQVKVKVEYSASPRYDYRQARRVGRRYKSAKRYYTRQNRRDIRDIRRDNKQKARDEKRRLPLAG